MLLENSEICFILISFFIVVNIMMLFFFILVYRNIFLPIPIINNNFSQNMTCLQVVDRYLAKRNISGLKVVNNPHQTLITRSYRKKTFFINDLQLFNQSYFLSGMGLDYVLGRLFYATQLHQKNKNIQTINFFLYSVPRILLLSFGIMVLLSLTFYTLIHLDSSLLEYRFMSFINTYGILNLLLIFVIGAYFVIVAFNSHLKHLLEDSYETEMTEFVKTEFQELYDDWVQARHYARSNSFTYLFGYNFIFKRMYKYTGPFGL